VGRQRHARHQVALAARTRALDAVDLSKLPGKGAGLIQAAANSPSLTICDGGVVSELSVIDPLTAAPVDVAPGVIAAA
jgi:hypothetical protein